MNRNLFTPSNIFYWFSLFILAVIYISHAPSTVQTGDSGELTAAAFRLLTPHPPGYPLWVWLNHFWISFVSVRTVYFSFALLSILIGVLTLWALSLNFKSKLVQVFSILTLGISTLFWRYVEIPEVFVLNLLVTFAVIWTGSSVELIPRTKIPIAAALMPILYSLGIANHHTIIFLLPFVLWVCWKQRKSPWLYLSISTGILICGTLYLSMMFMNPDHIYSWHGLHSAMDVWDHFIRKDYGTFSLNPTTNNGNTSLLYQQFSQNAFFASAPLLAPIFYSIYLSVLRKQTVKWYSYQTALAVCIVLYIAVFIPLMNIMPVDFGAEVTERFLLFPTSLLILLICSYLDQNLTLENKRARILIPSIFVLIIAISFWNNSRYNNFSDNTIVEDYASNLLKISSEFEKTILLASHDTHLFATRYLQVVHEIHPEVFVSAHAFFVSDWSLSKIAKHFPDLKIDSKKVLSTKELNPEVDVVKPNLTKYTFISSEDDFSNKTLKLTYLPLGFVLSEGSGFDTLKTKHSPEFRSDTSIIDTPFDRYDSFRNIFSKYTYYFMADGMINYKKENFENAIDSFDRALNLAPYTIQPLENLCKLKNRLKKPDPRCDQIDLVRGFFDYYQFNRAK